MSEILRLSNRRHDRRRVYFDRSELSLLLALYSDRVARGEWKDYAIDHADGIAWFSIFRHSSSGPAYAIAKECDPAATTMPSSTTAAGSSAPPHCARR